MRKHLFFYLTLFILFTSCDEPEFVQYFEYTDHNVLNIGSQLADLYITSDSNTLIAADKGNNRVIFIDVSTDDMAITKDVWVGSEPTSLDMTDDGRYLFVGLLGGSSVSIINMETMTLEGNLKMKQSSVFDIEYLSSKCQLIVSFLSVDPSYTNTFIHSWWADEDGEWYGDNSSCSYTANSSILTVNDFNIEESLSDHAEGTYDFVELSGGNGTGAFAKVVVHEHQYIESVEIRNGGEDYTKGDTLTIPGSEIGGSDGQCIITGTFNNPKIKLTNDDIIEVDPPQVYRLQSSSLATVPYVTYTGSDGAGEVDIAGLIKTSSDESHLYVLDKGVSENQLVRYEITENGLTNIIYSSTVSGIFEFFHDIAFIDGFGVVLAFNGSDPADGLKIDHAPVYQIDNVDHISNFDVGSVPLAVTYDSTGRHIYISPTDVDDNGMFIIEFSIDTQLQTNYYQVAGLLGSHALVVDPKGEYIYAAVDDLSDQDTHEPYNGSSFNIQKIKIIPEGTYPIN